jgi:chemotaxis response regulator CheB
MVMGAGLKRQRRKRVYLRIRRPLEIRDGNKFIGVYPDEGYSVEYRINFPHPCIGKSQFEVELSDGAYWQEIAAAQQAVQKSWPSAPINNTQKVKYTGGIRAVCIAASTGGPKALSKLMSMFPDGFKTPVLIVQHMPAGFTRAFAARLDGICKLNVKEGEHGEPVKPGWAYVAPGGYHMVVKGGCIELNQEPAMHGVRPCADKLFISAAEVFGRVLGVVLTGMGKDGTVGLQSIGERGGVCIAEDESTCTIFGMPRSAIEKGAAQYVTPLDRIVSKIVDIIGS